MTRQEFLDELRTLLNGNVSAEATMDAYRYYSNYIDEQVQSGKREEDVIEELGKPAFIAKSIIAAEEGKRDADVEYTEDGHQRKVRQSRVNRDNTGGYKSFRIDINGWLAKLVGILIFLLIVGIVFLLIKIGVMFFVTFGIPILIIAGILYLIMYFLK